jgi:O-antigen/teichoic acid export membrane protein
MFLMTILGIVGGLVVAALSPWLVGGKLAIPEGLYAETLDSFFLLAASIPVVIITTGFRGILEAHHRFDVVNIVRAPLGALTYLGPLFVLPYSHALPPVVAVLILGRIASGIAYLFVIMRLHPDVVRGPFFDARLLRQLLSFGGWMTLSNIAGPLLLYLGRLVLALLVSAEAVAYFSTPYDVVINLLLIPGIFVGVLFPMFCERLQGDASSVGALYAQAMRYTFLVMFPLALVTYLLAEPGLSWWISAAFSENSHRVAELLAIGIFINSFGHLSQALVQAYGRPDLTAKLHVVELAAYVPYMWWLIDHFGVEGAAIAWVVRVAISTIALAVMANGCLTGVVRKPHMELVG